MMIPSLLIVTDRGGLRAYKVTPNPSRAPGLHLLDSFEAQETHGRYEDKLTDRAGQFQGGSHGTGNGPVGGADEHGTIDIENERRACKHVAARINELVMREKPETWLLAVPAQIDKLITRELQPAVVKHLGNTVHANLLKVAPDNLGAHFPELQPA